MKAFFVDLYHKFINLSWVAWTIEYCKAQPVMAAIVGGVALFVIVILLVMAGISGKARRKRKAAKKAAKQAAKQANTQAVTTNAPLSTEQKESEPIKAEETVSEQGNVERVENKIIEEPAIPSAPVNTEQKTQVQEENTANTAVVKEKRASAEGTSVEERKEEVAVALPEEDTVEEVAVVEEEISAPAETLAKEEREEIAPAAVERQSKAQEVEETFAMIENVDESIPEVLRDNYEENETDRIAKYKGKWAICRMLTNDEETEEMYFFELHAADGEKLLSSEEYATYQGALRGILTHRTNILKGNLKIALSAKGDYVFKLLSGKNMLLCVSDNYPTEERCKRAIDLTIRFAATAIIDENVQDIVIKVPKEEDISIPPPPEDCTGKWIISSGLNAEGATVFYFELFTSDGEKLLSSEEYATYIGAVNGIQTHKKNIQSDNFRICLTKRGDYCYKLMNGNGQLLCLSEHYRTKRICQDAVETVKRFAESNTILTKEEK